MILTKKFHNGEETEKVKTTAKKIAQRLIIESLDSALLDWGERHFVDFDSLTSKEKNEIDVQLDKYLIRINKIIGAKQWN